MSGVVFGIVHIESGRIIGASTVSFGDAISDALRNDHDVHQLNVAIACGNAPQSGLSRSGYILTLVPLALESLQPLAPGVEHG